MHPKSRWHATTPAKKREVLLNCFREVYVRHHSARVVVLSRVQTSQTPTAIITAQDAAATIGLLNKHKALRPDETNANILVSPASTADSPLAELFPVPLELGKLPNTWRLTEVVAVRKSGRRDEVKKLQTG